MRTRSGREDAVVVRHRAVVYLLTFIAFTDTFALLPIVGPYAETMGATAFGMGLVLGAYSVTDVVFNVVGGVLLDRGGRRRLALTGFGIVTVAVLLYPAADTVGTLVAVRLLHGVGGGILIPALYTYVGDLARAGGRGRAMGRVGATIGAAAVVAPAVAGVARSRAGFAAVFVGLAVVMAIGFVVTALAIRETLDPSTRSEATEHSIRSLLRIRDLRTACIAAFGFTVGFGTLSAFLASRIEELDHGPEVSGGLFTLLALVAVILMLTRVAGRVDTRGPRRPVLAGLPAIAVGLTVIGASAQLQGIAVGMVLFGIGFGIVYPAVSGAAAAAAPLAGRGRAFGIFSVCYSAGFILGPPVAGQLTDTTGISPFHVAAVSTALVIVLVAAVSRDHDVDTPDDLVTPTP